MRLGRRTAVLLLTLAVHAGLLWLLVRAGQATVQRQPSRQRLLVQLIVAPPPALQPAPTKVPPRSSPQPRPEPRPVSRPIEEVPTAAAAPTLAAALPAETTASAPAPVASAPWLDPEKTRLAVRRMAAQPSMRELAAQASEAPRKPTAGERFGQEVQQAAVGDCLKGEFLGGGMGLLSAPFWALAEARGKCRR